MIGQFNFFQVYPVIIGFLLEFSGVHVLPSNSVAGDLPDHGCNRCNSKVSLSVHGFHSIDQPDLFQCIFSSGFIFFQGFSISSPGMCPATKKQNSFLILVWFRLDREAPKENHRPRCDARAGPEGNSLNVHSWLLVYY